MAKDMKGSKTGATQASAEQLYEFLKKVRRYADLAAFTHVTAWVGIWCAGQSSLTYAAGADERCSSHELLMWQ